MVIGSCKGSLDAFYSDQNTSKKFDSKSNRTELVCLGRLEYLRWSTLTVSLVSVECTNLMKLLSPVPLFCILLTSTIN